MAVTGPTTSTPNGKELFHQAFDRVMLHAMLVSQKKSEYPTLQGCFSVLEQHGQKWMDRYLKDAGLVSFPDIGWRRIPQKEIVIASSKDMETAVLQAMTDVSAFQPNGTTLEELWTFFRAAFRMPESSEALKSLKEKLQCGIESLKTWEKITVRDNRYTLPTAVPSDSKSPATPKDTPRDALPVAAHASELQPAGQIILSVKKEAPSTASMSFSGGLSVSSPCSPTVTSSEISKMNLTALLPKADKDVVMENLSAQVTVPEVVVPPKETPLPVVLTNGCKREVSISFKADLEGTKRQRVETAVAPVEQKYQAVTGTATSSAQNQVAAPLSSKPLFGTVESISRVVFGQMMPHSQAKPDTAPTEPAKALNFPTGDLMKVDSSAPFKLQSVPKTESILPAKPSFAVPSSTVKVQFCNEWVPPLNFTVGKPVAGVNGAPAVVSTQNVVYAQPAAVAPVAVAPAAVAPAAVAPAAVAPVAVDVLRQFWLDAEKARAQGSLSGEIYKIVQRYACKAWSIMALVQYKDSVLTMKDGGYAAKKLKGINSQQWNVQLGFAYLIWESEMLPFVSQLNPKMDDRFKIYLRKKAEFSVKEYWKRSTWYLPVQPTTNPNMVTAASGLHPQQSASMNNVPYK